MEDWYKNVAQTQDDFYGETQEALTAQLNQLRSELENIISSKFK